MAAEYLERMGRRMRERREELGLSRPDVVRAMPGKTNENQLYRWEKGLHRPEDDALEALAEVLEVSSVGWFFVDEPDKTQTPDLSLHRDGSQLDRIEAALTEAVSERKAISDLLARQTGLLEDIEAATRRASDVTARLQETARLADQASQEVARRLAELQAAATPAPEVPRTTAK